MRHIRFTIPITKSLACFLLIAVAGLPMICQAADNNPSNPSPVAYVYTGSSIKHGQFYYNYLTGFAIAADGSAQALTGFPLNGDVGLLTAAAGHVFAVGDWGREVVTYTVASDGSLAQTSSLNVASYLGPYGYYQGVYALNPDREGHFFNIVMSCGSCNSEILPFRIGSDGKLSLSGLILEGGAKWGGEYIFSPDDQYAYTLGYGGPLAKEKLQSNGMLTFAGDTNLLPPPLPPFDNICLPGDMAVSSQGYMATTWWGDQYWCDQYSNGYALANYSVDAEGNLNLVPGSGSIPAVEEYAMAFDPTGTYLAIAGGIFVGFDERPRQAAIEVLKLQSDGTLVPVGAPVNVPELGGLEAVAWDNSHHLYAVGGYQGCLASCGLYIFNSNDGVLTPAPGSPHPVNGIGDMAVLPLQ